MSVYGYVEIPDDSNPDVLVKRIGNSYFVAPAHVETDSTTGELPEGWVELGYVTDEGVS